MSARANQQDNKATNQRVASSTKGARGNKTKNNGSRVEERRANNPGRRKDDVKPVVSGEVKSRKTAKKELTIGAYVNGLLMHDKSTEEILKAVAKKFPEARTSAASVAWYRSKLNKQGKH